MVRNALTLLTTIFQQLTTSGMDVTNYIDFYYQVSRLELSPEAIVIISHVRKYLREIRVSVDDAKTATLLRLGHASIEVDIALFTSFGVSVEAADGAVVVTKDRDSRFGCFRLTSYSRGCARRMRQTPCSIACS